MRAILLAAGVGGRMGPGPPPKCLTPIGGRTLLCRTLDTLRSVGVLDVVLVVGYSAPAVAAEASAHAHGLRLTTVENPRYCEGAILSLWTARDYLTDPLLVMDADVLCPPALLERLIYSPHPNGLLVDRGSTDTGEEQIVLGRGTQAFQITKQPSEGLRHCWTPLGESVGFLKVSREAAGRLRRLLDSAVQPGQTQVEHEQLYPDLFQQVPVHCEWVDGLPWIEIDTPEDRRRAETEVLPRWAPSPCLNRVMARRGLSWAARWPLTPNQWTGVSLALGCAAAAAVADGRYGVGVLGALGFQAFYITDIWDGEIARLRGLSSRWGSWFDLAVDGLVHTALGAALAIGLWRAGGPSWVAPVGAAAAVGLALDFLVTAWTKLSGVGTAVYGDPSRRGLATNLTNENFSLLVAALLILNLRLPLLVALAVGSQVFWITYLWRYSFAQARR